MHDPTCVGRPGAPVPRGPVGPEGREQRQDQGARAAPVRPTTRRRPPRRSTTRARWSASRAIATRPSAASAPSTRCSGSRTARRREIPNLGGTTWHTPMDINAQGDVVGFSNPPGAGDPEGEFISRAFRWVYGAATADDLEALPGRSLQRSVRHQRAWPGGGRVLRRRQRLPRLHLAERRAREPQRSRRHRARRAGVRPGHQRCRPDHGPGAGWRDGRDSARSWRRRSRTEPLRGSHPERSEGGMPRSMPLRSAQGDSRCKNA